MKKLSVLCVALCVSLSTTAAFARGGGTGSHRVDLLWRIRISLAAVCGLFWLANLAIHFFKN
ncbi:hypothetical protein [Bradyrhizobium canariense]|uniref:Uncharacterized protein n=1 Tax=Bradyrhizobium canariense TaxID=255045 RepID=A0A1H1UYV4_9BRAD|nr:hypothetical protein [Bradyrhizobium canariense]SDS77550.1 hypothetical protein SAMN05444158_3161 [Bradyrhizobium canariense]